MWDTGSATLDPLGLVNRPVDDHPFVDQMTIHILFDQPFPALRIGIPGKIGDDVRCCNSLRTFERRSIVGIAPHCIPRAQPGRQFQWVTPPG